LPKKNICSLYARKIDFLTVSGKVEPVRVYEIIAPAGCLSATEQELNGLFAEGLAAYRARDWNRSEQRFAQCLADRWAGYRLPAAH
jgi:adenylate cyclase